MTRLMITARLGLLRRRLAGNAVIHYALPCMGAGAIVGWAVPGWLGGLLAVGTAAAGAWLAWRHTPSLRRAAQIVDRRLDADDELVTALDTFGDDDAMAALLRDRAWKRLDAVAPSRIVPLATRAAAFAGGGLLAAAIVLANAGPSIRENAGGVAREGSQSAAPPVASTNAPSRLPEGTGAAAAESPAARAGEPDRADATTARSGNQTVDPSSDERQRQEAVLQVDRSASDTTAPASQGQAAPASEGSPAPVAGRQAGRQGATPAEVLAPLERRATRPSDGRPIEVAIDRADLPPGLRGYLRNYFLALERK